ncbi:9505_t:CDS:2 [Diversispora eburnea]|uniref:9505_t:CDS:1 n=1 Tax=Diversispora eburnea TaxID=1213867 RepID=A0A9N8V3F4_9GLOM|nr:9505_t:CDS:2 [Diversispora eburnea]
MSALSTFIKQRSTFSRINTQNYYQNLYSLRKFSIYQSNKKPIEKADQQIPFTVSKDNLKVGCKVIYHPVGGSSTTSEGIVKGIITEPEPAGSTQVEVKASDEHPRILIENLNTRKETAYKLENIEKIIEA